MIVCLRTSRVFRAFAAGLVALFLLTGAVDLAQHIACSHHDEDGHAPDLACECLVMGASCTFAAKTVANGAPKIEESVVYASLLPMDLGNESRVLPGHFGSLDRPPRA